MVQKVFKKFCKSRVSIFPGKFPGKRDLDGKFPVSREAEKSGKLQTLTHAAHFEGVKIVWQGGSRLQNIGVGLHNDDVIKAPFLSE